MYRVLARLSPVVLLSACAPTYLAAPTGDDAAGARSALTGSPLGVGLVTFLNDPSTTLAVLDHEVPLDKRTADQIVLYRSRDAFDSVEEVDAVPWVGPAAMDALLLYVETHGWVPAGDEPLGTWDGVTFTVDEAVAVLDLVNGSTVADLDLFLDRRAADSIVAAQPVETVHELAGLYYVGASALETLVAEATGAPICDDATLVAAAHDAAEDFTLLVEIGASWDWPYAEVRAYAIPGCAKGAWLDDPAATDAIVDQLWAITFTGWDLSDLPDQYEITGPWHESGGTFHGVVDRARQAVEERVAEGSFDPSADPEAQALYDARYALVEALVAEAAATPSRYREIVLEIDASECSQEAAIRFDLETDEVLIGRQYPGC